MNDKSITEFDMGDLTLVFDAGSTKTEVGIISYHYDGMIDLNTILIPGINPVVGSEDAIISSLKEVKVESPYDVKEVYFYGAGCATDRICERIRKMISGIWPNAVCCVASDMLGAARGLLQTSPGVACILGTGSNSALYNGELLIDNIPPLGYVLGDEGSGTALGKRLIGDVFKRIAPEDIRQKFFDETGLSKELVIEKVYRGETPNKFLASVVPFIKQNIENTYIRNMAGDVFGLFFDRNLMQYEGISNLTVNFTGSVAYHFEDIIRSTANTKGLQVGVVSAKPMVGLINYHLNRKREYDEV